MLRHFYLILLSLFFHQFIYAQFVVNASAALNSATYTSLKASFDAINSGTHQGQISILVGSANDQVITETLQPVLNKSGAGAANYTAVTIQPAFQRITVNAAFAGSCCIPSAVVNLAGANNIQIDGRIQPGDTVKNLTFENTSVASSYGSTIVFNGASNNSIQYCTIKSSSTYATIAFLYNNASKLGSQNNNISNCTITKSGSNLPLTAILSTSASGTNSLAKNSNNQIAACDIRDFKRYGIWLGSSSSITHDSAWIISNNQFVQTTTLTLDNTNFCNYAICVGYHDIAGSTTYSGTGTHQIINNNIGGDAIGGNCNFTSSTANSGLTVGGIFLAASGTVFSEISGNIISHYNVGSFVSDQSSLSLAGFNGIYVLNSKVKIGTSKGNEIHDIILDHKYNSWSGIISGIYLKNNTDKSCEIMNNKIFNIHAVTGTGSFQYFYGIKTGGSSSVYTDQIKGNSIYNLNLKLNSNCWAINAYGAISQNHISKVKVQNGSADLIGIQFNGVPSASISAYRIANNEVLLGVDSLGTSSALTSNIVGIYLNSTAHAFYNSVLITGTHTGSTNSTCFRVNNTTGSGYTMANNLLYNNRVGGTGVHYNIIANGTGSLAISNNAYILNTINKLGLWNNATMCNRLSNWSSASGEVNAISDSIINKPLNSFFSQAFLQVGENLFPFTDGWLCKGIATTELLDYNGYPRNATAPTTIGCYELECDLINNSNAIYVFTGNGDWSVDSNWQSRTIPPSALPSGNTIIIDPINSGECYLNVPQVINPGANIFIRRNKKFNVPQQIGVQ
jgi:hypothetical protein